MSCAQARATARSGITLKENPVRADLVKKSDEWPWQGRGRIANVVADQ